MKAKKAKAGGAADVKKRKAKKADGEGETLRELLAVGNVIVDRLEMVAGRLESIRRTLWRIGEVRAYKGGNGEPANVTAGADTPSATDAPATPDAPATAGEVTADTAQGGAE